MDSRRRATAPGALERSAYPGATPSSQPSEKPTLGRFRRSTTSHWATSAPRMRPSVTTCALRHTFDNRSTGGTRTTFQHFERSWTGDSRRRKPSLLLRPTTEKSRPLAQREPRRLNGLQTLWLCYERGLLPAIAPLPESVAGSFGEIPALSAARVWVSAEAGNIERATEELDRLVRDDFDIPQTDIAWLAAMCLLASAAATVEHEVAARKLREVIAPYSGRNVLVWVGMCCGPVDHYLGRLNVCLGDLEAYAEAFDAAVEMTTAMNATPLNLRVRLDRCQVAIRSGAAQVDVLVELDEIGRRAWELGMAGVAAAASSLGFGNEGKATISQTLLASAQGWRKVDRARWSRRGRVHLCQCRMVAKDEESRPATEWLCRWLGRDAHVSGACFPALRPRRRRSGFLRVLWPSARSPWTRRCSSPSRSRTPPKFRSGSTQARRVRSST